MDAPGDDEKKKVDAFLSSLRSDDVKHYAFLIMEHLIKRKMTAGPDGEGWVRGREIHEALVQTAEIPHGTTFFRILAGLEKAGIIEQRKHEPGGTPGRGAVFFRSKEFYPISWFMTRDDLLTEYAVTYDRAIRRYNKLKTAIKMLEDLGVEDPEKKINESVKQPKRSRPSNVLIWSRYPSDVDD
ncbi:MAG: hypothetical protein NT074_00975 [Methanomicrobiales archaeon]|jgi:hypothetical protein|nr:hypothetical protein [Methanomicrobiales archaeon]